MGTVMRTLCDILATAGIVALIVAMLAVAVIFEPAVTAHNAARLDAEMGQ